MQIDWVVSMWATSTWGMRQNAEGLYYLEQISKEFLFRSLLITFVKKGWYKLTDKTTSSGLSYGICALFWMTYLSVQSILLAEKKLKYFKAFILEKLIHFKCVCKALCTTIRTLESTLA